MSALQRTTPRSAKSRQRVTTLLAAARSVFSEHGFQHATTAMIAERAGVSEATVFTYFPGKRELCAQVIKDWYDEITQDLQRELPRLPSIEAQLVYVVRAHLLTLLAEGSGMCALVLGEGRTAGAGLSEVITECLRHYTAPLMDCLAQARHQGEIRQDMPLSLLRDLVYGSMEHVLWDSITDRKRPPIDETAEQLSTLIWAALKPPLPADAQHTSLAALARFKDDISDALRKLEHRDPPCP
jgi:AcrR family transcriptional regulator